MSGSRDNEREDGDLWRRFAHATSEVAQEGEVDPNVLAAYLDGTARADEVKAVERAMGADPSLVDAVAELREVLEADPAGLPERVPALIKAALSGGAARAASGPTAPVRAPLVPWYAGVAAAAAILIASFIGFEVGRHGVGDDTDRGSAISRELAPELEDASFDSGLLAAFGRVGEWNGGAR